MRKIAIVAYCCFIATCFYVGWWASVVYLITAAVFAVLLGQLWGLVQR